MIWSAFVQHTILEVMDYIPKYLNLMVYIFIYLLYIHGSMSSDSAIFITLSFHFYPFLQVFDNFLTFIFRLIIFNISIFIIFHIKYHHNQFIQRSILYPPLDKCKELALFDSPKCMEAVKHHIPDSSTLSVPWIGLVTQSIFDVFLGIGASFNRFMDKNSSLLIFSITSLFIILIVLSIAFLYT